MAEELSKELELDIKGAAKPSIWELVGIRFLLLPYTLGKVYIFYFPLYELDEKFISFTCSCTQPFFFFFFFSIELTQCKTRKLIETMNWLISSTAVIMVWVLVLAIQVEASTIFMARCLLSNKKIPGGAC